MVENKSTTKIVNTVDLQVHVMKYEIERQGNFVNYIIRVVGPRDIQFHLKDRYSSMRDFQVRVKRSIGGADGTPIFPRKKWFGNTNPAFLERRSQALGIFLQMFLAHPLVKQCHMVPHYFSTHAYGDDSKDAILQLIGYMSG